MLLLLETVSRFKHDILNIDKPYFEGIIGRIYPHEVQLRKLMRLIPKSHFWIYICLFQTELFHQKFMISKMILILT